jgi:hypothetical protein
MAVYVDDMHRSPLGRFRRMKMCHMIAEDEAELHRMAGRIGVERRWYQGDHYDLPVSKRLLAVRHGAIEIGMRELAALAFLQRVGEAMGAPETAIQRMREWKYARLTPAERAARLAWRSRIGRQMAEGVKEGRKG